MADIKYNLTPNSITFPYVLTPTSRIEFNVSEFTKDGDEKLKRGYYININYSALNDASLKIGSDGKWLPGTHKFVLKTETPPVEPNPEEPSEDDYEHIHPNQDLWICWYPLPNHHWFEDEETENKYNPIYGKCEDVVIASGIGDTQHIYITSIDSEKEEALKNDIINGTNISWTVEARDIKEDASCYVHRIDNISSYDPSLPFWKVYQAKIASAYNFFGTVDKETYVITCHWVYNGVTYDSNPIYYYCYDNHAETNPPTFEEIRSGEFNTSSISAPIETNNNIQPYSEVLTGDNIKVYITERGLKTLQETGLTLTGNNITINDVYIADDGFIMDKNAIWGGYHTTNSALEIYRYAFDESDEYRTITVKQKNETNLSSLETFAVINGAVVDDWVKPLFLDNKNADLADVDFLSLFKGDDDCIAFSTNPNNFFDSIILTKDWLLTVNEDGIVDIPAENCVSTIEGVKDGLDSIWGNNEDNYNKYLIITFGSYDKIDTVYNSNIPLINVMDRWVSENKTVRFRVDGYGISEMSVTFSGSEEDDNNSNKSGGFIERKEGRLIVYLDGSSHQINVTPNNVCVGSEYIYGSNAYYTQLNTSTNNNIKSIGDKSEWLKKTNGTYYPLKINSWCGENENGEIVTQTDEEYDVFCSTERAWCFKSSIGNYFSITVNKNNTNSTRSYAIEYCADNDTKEPKYVLEIQQFPLNEKTLSFQYNDYRITPTDDFPYPINFICYTEENDINKEITKDDLTVDGIKLNNSDNNVTMYLTPTKISQSVGQNIESIHSGTKYLVNFSRTNKIKSIRIQDEDTDTLSTLWPSFDMSKKEIYIVDIPSLFSENNGIFFNAYHNVFEDDSALPLRPPFNREVENLIKIGEINLEADNGRFYFFKNNLSYDSYNIGDEVDGNYHVLISPTKKNSNKVDTLSNCLGTESQFSIYGEYNSPLLQIIYYPLVLSYAYNTQFYGITNSTNYDKVIIDDYDILKFSCTYINNKNMSGYALSDISMYVYSIKGKNESSTSDILNLDFYDTSLTNFNSKKISFNIKLTNV